MTEGVIIAIVTVVGGGLFTYLGIRSQNIGKRVAEEFQFSINKIGAEVSTIKQGVADNQTHIGQIQSAMKIDREISLSHLRADLDNRLNDAIEQGYTTRLERRQLCDLYDKYKLGGGNTYIDDLYAAYIGLDIKET